MEWRTGAGTGYRGEAGRLANEVLGRLRAAGVGALTAALVVAGAMSCARESCSECLACRGGTGGSVDIIGDVVEPALGVVKVNELYLSVSDPPPSTAFAQTVNVGGQTVSDPNRDGVFNTCDKFVEIVNVTGQPLDMQGVKLYAGASSAPAHKFGNVVIPAHGALLLFYGYKECKGKSPTGLDSGVVVTEWPAYNFVPMDSSSPVRMESADGVELDRLYYPKPKVGVSVVREVEIDGGDLKVKSGTAVDHRSHPCALTLLKEEKTLHLALSPGTCANGTGFSDEARCACTPQQFEDVLETAEPDGDVAETAGPAKDLVESDGGSETQSQDSSQPPAPIEPGAVLVTEVRPFVNGWDPNHDLHQDACDKFVELVATTAVDLEGAELLIKGKTGHLFGDAQLAAGEALVLFSGATDCAKDYSGLPFKALAATKSFYSLLVVNPPLEGVTVRLMDAYGTTVDEFVYSDATAVWKEKFGLTKLSWDDVKALNCSFVREEETNPAATVVPHPFAPVFLAAANFGVACKQEACALSPGTCASGLAFPNCQ